MSDEEVETSKNALDVLSKASELASKFSAVTNILGIVQNLTSVFPFVGAVLGFVKSFLPDSKHEEILRCFEKLSNQIYQVKDDIKALERMIKWEITQLQYVDAVGRIELGMEFCVEIGKRSGQDEKMRYQERLKEVCANQNFTFALTALLDGMIGKGLFQKSILDEFYNETKGDRQKVSALAIRLLQLVCSEFMVVCSEFMVMTTYETVMRGTEGAKEETERFDGRFKEVNAKVQSVLDKCETNFRENMLSDLNEKLDKGGSNECLVIEVSDLMRDKYDWLENFCLVYNDLYGFDQNCFNGHRVESLHRNGKCGIVFYRTKGEPHTFSHRFDEAYKIVDTVRCGDAQEAYNSIVATLGERGIEWTGCAVLTRSPDLGLHRTFSTTYVGIEFTFKTFHGRAGITEYKAEKFLLLK